MKVLTVILLILFIVPSHAHDSRPPQCPQTKWCGCWLADHFGMADKALWRAREWLKLGHPISRPIPGAIAVYARGKGGHVGVITAVTGPHSIILWSGNDGGAIRERERSTHGVIGYRQL